MQKKYTIYFIIFYILSYGIFSFSSTKFTPYLSEIGYSAFQRGVILSGYAAATIVLQLLFGILSDRYQTMKKIIIVSLCVYGIVSALLFSTKGATIAVYFVLVSLSGGLLNSCCGLYDTWVLGCHEEIRKNLSFIKAFGSIGWAIGSMAASLIISLFSYRGLGISIIVITLLSLLNLIALPDIDRIKGRSKLSVADFRQLIKNKQYVLLIIILFLMYSMVIVNNCTVIDKMIALHASDAQISMKWSVQSLLEIPTYLTGAYLLARFNGLKLLRLSSLMLTFQFVLFALAQNPGVIIGASILQLFSTPIILVASKMLILEIAPDKLKSSSQLIALSIFTGGSSMLMPATAGFFSEHIGFNLTLICVALLGICSFLLTYPLSKMSS
ncbi:MAG: MFS transporter [Lachnospiraceae bacterium]|nr:MFS transporter [Lachnospiraceae bacterium]